MSRAKKLNIIIPVVLVLFFGAYARHKYLNDEITISGHLQDKEMNEISGMAASGISKDIYYVHNDSGDSSRIFAIHPDGKLITTIHYTGDHKHDMDAYDCEDIAVGPGPDPKKSYVYVGDIGDNYNDRKYIAIYRIEEQASWLKHGYVRTGDDMLTLKYPDVAKDAETLMVDPLQRLLYVVTKRRDTVNVYTTPLDFKDGDKVILTFRCKLFFKGFKPFKWISAGDISKDGRQILLKNYEKVFYWKRKGNEPVWQTMQRSPDVLNYMVEKQGEAIAFTPDGKGYYTTSEGIYSPIYYYKTP